MVTTFIGVLLCIPSFTGADFFAKVKLGLDLQGGLYTVLGVKKDEAVEAKIKTMALGFKYYAEKNDVLIDSLKVEPAKFSFTLIDKEAKSKIDEYFKKEKVKVDWQFMLVCGIFLGALASAVTGRAFEWEGVPPLWQKRFGPSEMKRVFGGFFGGVVAMFGARMADGCPSGHGLSGLMQLSVSGLVAVGCFFAGGVLAARCLNLKGSPYE